MIYDIQYNKYSHTSMRTVPRLSAPNSPPSLVEILKSQLATIFTNELHTQTRVRLFRIHISTSLSKRSLALPTWYKFSQNQIATELSTSTDFKATFENEYVGFYF